MKDKINYKSSGVNVNKADSLVSWIKKTNPSSIESMGNDYAALLSLPFHKYKNPVIASCTDGVGTKVKLASHFGEWEGIGQDLLAMCVNDLLCTGAKPLYFLDYYACGKLDSRQSKSFLKGLFKACKKSSCKLVGGETAELPGLYQKGDMDCAGFAIGIVEKSKILGAHKVKIGDDVIALKSSGFHSNGYSLLRKIYKSQKDLKKQRKVLMEPTRLYTFLSPHIDKIKGLKAIAHITGGGLDNLSRVLPKGMQIQMEPWNIPDCFLDVKKRSNMSWNSLLKTLNCGLGLVLILSKKEEFLKKNIIPKKDVIYLGKVSKGSGSKSWSVDYKALEKKNV